MEKAKKKIPMLMLGLVALGAVGSIAFQSFAQTAQTSASNQTVVDTSNQKDGVIDQKDAQGNDIETNDDAKSSLGLKKKVQMTTILMRKANKGKTTMGKMV